MFRDVCPTIPSNWLNISITAPGGWTANSLSEMTVTCKPQMVEERVEVLPDGGAIEEGGEESANSLEAVEEEEQTRRKEQEELVEWLETARQGDHILLEGIEDIIQSMRMGGDQISELSGQSTAVEEFGYPRDHRLAMSAFALEILAGGGSGTPSASPASPASPPLPTTSNMDQSGSFLAVANHHYLGHPVDYLRRLLRLSNRTHATTSVYSATESSCAASAALYWHEARIAVGGDTESGVHPTPIQELKLSEADSEE